MYACKPAPNFKGIYASSYMPILAGMGDYCSATNSSLAAGISFHYLEMIASLLDITHHLVTMLAVLLGGGHATKILIMNPIFNIIYI